MDVDEQQYFRRVVDRTGRLERKEVSLRQDTSRSQRSLILTAADLEQEMAELGKELVELEKLAIASADRTRHALKLFKQVVKRGDFVRLQNRVDVWAPEQRVTRAQFLKMLE